MREEAAKNGMDVLAANQASGERIRMEAAQIAVLLGCERLMSALALEAGHLTECWGQGEAAKELESAFEHIKKFHARYLAEAQRRIVVPKPSVVLK